MVSWLLVSPANGNGPKRGEAAGSHIYALREGSKRKCLIGALLYWRLSKGPYISEITIRLGIDSHLTPPPSWPSTAVLRSDTEMGSLGISISKTWVPLCMSCQDCRNVTSNSTQCSNISYLHDVTGSSWPPCEEGALRLGLSLCAWRSCILQHHSASHLQSHTSHWQGLVQILVLPPLLPAGYCCHSLVPCTFSSRPSTNRKISKIPTPLFSLSFSLTCCGVPRKEARPASISASLQPATWVLGTRT